MNLLLALVFLQFVLPTTELDFTITYTGRSPDIEGYVVDLDGNPVSGAIIYVVEPFTHVISDDTGSFTFWSVKHGVRDIVVSKEGYGEVWGDPYRELF